MKLRHSQSMIKSVKNKQYLFCLFKKNNFRRINLFLKSFFLIFLLFLVSRNLVFAQVVLQTDRDVRVTATVPDIVPPSTPILINPEDGANLDNAYPVFQWYESTDNKDMSHYQFFLDGRLWFDKIPLTDFANDQYSLDYDPNSGIYTLVAKKALTHGSHRWQIVAWDFGDNSAGSATWKFNVFTKDPVFNLKKIGDVAVNISSDRPDSVPQNPISLFQRDPFANEPWIIALGDANLKVDLVVTIPNRASLFYSQYTDAKGDWSLQLDLLPRNQIIRLDFIISDVVGHTSYIKNLYIIIPQHYWPATPIPSVTVTETPSTTPPTGTSTTPTISQTIVSPTPSPTPRGIQVPIIPPREIVQEVFEEVRESLPSRIATFITEFARTSLWKSISQFIALFFALLLPITTYLLLLLKFYRYLSWASLKKVFLALWPWSRRKNLVFEYRNSQAAPLVRVELIDAETKEVIDWQITSYLGQFFDFSWPNDTALTLEVKDNNFYFPIGEQKPAFLTWYNFYQKEVFMIEDKDQQTEAKNTDQPAELVNDQQAEVKNTDQPAQIFDNQQTEAKNTDDQPAHLFNAKRALAIPTLMAEGKNNLPIIERIRIILAYLLSYPWWLWTLGLLFILPFVLRYPSIFNYLALIYYLIIALIKYFYVSGSKTWQFRALYSNARQIDQNLILVVNDLDRGFSQAQVVKMSDSLSDKIHLLTSNFIFHLQTKDYAFWDGQGVISESEYRLGREKTKDGEGERDQEKVAESEGGIGRERTGESEGKTDQEKISEFKMHPMTEADHKLRNLRLRCQLLPRR